jgi:hypothetical protein
MPARADGDYQDLLLTPLAECATYRPAFGQEGDKRIDLPHFRALYAGDPLYHWVGLDSDLMYAAHKAAGGMTSIYRQLGIGCERLLRAVMRDCLALSEAQTAWSYQYDKGNGVMAVHKLDARIVADHVRDLEARRRVLGWVHSSAQRLGLPRARAKALVGAAFEIRQGYKSADSKRQAADIRFGIRARDDANLLPVIAIVSTQASDVVCRRYRDSHLLVLRGQLAGEESTFEFFREVIGYDLAAFFQRNTLAIRTAFQDIIGRLLTP